MFKVLRDSRGHRKDLISHLETGKIFGWELFKMDVQFKGNAEKKKPWRTQAWGLWVGLAHRQRWQKSGTVRRVGNVVFGRRSWPNVKQTWAERRAAERRGAGRDGGGTQEAEHWVPEWMFSLPVPTPFFSSFFNEEFKFQARRSWPLCSSPAESRRGGGPVARNKRPHRLRRCRRSGAPVCRTAGWPAGQTGSSASSWPSCLGGLPGDM